VDICAPSFARAAAPSSPSPSPPSAASLLRYRSYPPESFANSAPSRTMVFRLVVLARRADLSTHDAVRDVDVALEHRVGFPPRVEDVDAARVDAR